MRQQFRRQTGCHQITEECLNPEIEETASESEESPKIVNDNNVDFLEVGDNADPNGTDQTQNQRHIAAYSPSSSLTKVVPVEFDDLSVTHVYCHSQEKGTEIKKLAKDATLG